MTSANQKRTHYLVKGCTPPNDAELGRFWNEARNAVANANLPDNYQVRWIGGDDESTRNILQHFRTGDKTGSVTLPWVVRNTGQPEPGVGDAIILINFDGTPALLVRTTAIQEVPYGEITEEHTALDGPRVRALPIWKPLHEPYFNKLLAPYQLQVSDETPIWFETFEVLYPLPV